MTTSPASKFGVGSASLETLSDTFKCYICMEQLKKAQMCPHCSKMCCLECIVKWITQNKTQCPFCRRTLFPQMLVHCRWADDVIQQLNQMRRSDADSRSCDSDSEKCELHDERLSVFCVTCDRVICHHCALFDNSHSQHNFRPLLDVYNEQVSIVMAGMEKLKARRSEINRLIFIAKQSIVEVQRQLERRKSDVERFFKPMLSKLENSHQAIVGRYTSKCRHLSIETELIDSILLEVGNQLKTTTPATMISRVSAFNAMFAEVESAPMPSLSSYSPPYDPTNELAPPFNCGKIKIRNFSHIQHQVEPVYSSPVEFDGVVWRLKVYPMGNGAVRNTYLSVFLEMMTGPTESEKYDYYIELEHQGPPRDEAKSVAREFASEFAEGECWGYNRFIRLDLLYSDGYISSDCLYFTFKVRCQTYQRKCANLLWHIRRLEAEKAKLQGKCQNMEVHVLSSETALQHTRSATGVVSPSSSAPANPKGGSDLSQSSSQEGSAIHSRFIEGEKQERGTSSLLVCERGRDRAPVGVDSVAGVETEDEESCDEEEAMEGDEEEEENEEGDDDDERESDNEDGGSNYPVNAEGDVEGDQHRSEDNSCGGNRSVHTVDLTSQHPEDGDDDKEAEEEEYEDDSDSNEIVVAMLDGFRRISESNGSENAIDEGLAGAFANDFVDDLHRVPLPQDNGWANVETQPSTVQPQSNGSNASHLHPSSKSRTPNESLIPDIYWPLDRAGVSYPLEPSFCPQPQQTSPNAATEEGNQQRVVFHSLLRRLQTIKDDMSSGLQHQANPASASQILDHLQPGPSVLEISAAMHLPSASAMNGDTLTTVRSNSQIESDHARARMCVNLGIMRARILELEAEARAILERREASAANDSSPNAASGSNEEADSSRSDNLSPI